ncbi:carboxymuconolactone decarboxylase family protein [Methanobacterium sp.]|uniref:carboxymuconolactone decarboxylase family protein n=1 Tax=Methanobacterium sp. TaxID=2164 RepID=UPI0025E9A1A3|nr:carboxymuconolactone decarboxylase family protein [Methanobacterium sp.]MBI5458623.1 carboxymuconolactone decarboxylase family protein [Methanobacterium sp.]MDY9923355.1 carboxymuconolactone decarboxylase family protein [Methanobacterium sp.]
MKEDVFYGKGMVHVKKDYPDIYKAVVELNEAAYSGKVLDYRTQKLIALGITAAASDDRAMKKQMVSAMKEFDISRDEIVDVLRVVLLTSGNPPFTKAMKILYDISE